MRTEPNPGESMDAGLAFHAAQAVLAVHVTIAAFILFGLVAIPIGARLGWVFVYGFWWRLAHSVAMGAVAGQKLIGGACFLSVWEDRLLAMAGSSAAPRRRAPATICIVIRMLASLRAKASLWTLCRATAASKAATCRASAL